MPRTKASSVPHVNELPLRQRLRVYLAGAAACEEYELRRNNVILREALERIASLDWDDDVEVAEIARAALERPE